MNIAVGYEFVQKPTNPRPGTVGGTVTRKTKRGFVCRIRNSPIKHASKIGFVSKRRIDSGKKIRACLRSKTTRRILHHPLTNNDEP